MNLTERLTQSYIRTLVRTPRGRAHLLTQVALAESSDEGRIFESLATRVGDHQLTRMIQRHAEDEERHAELFLQCVERTGLPPAEVPSELMLIDRLDEALGYPLERGVHTDTDVLDLYLILQVIEERAMTQFDVFEKAFRPIDPETADVFAAVAKDEERHLKYCHAIAKRYAPDPERHSRALARIRKVEAQVFAETSHQNLRYALEQGLLTGSAKIWWSLISHLRPVRAEDHFTPFAGTGVSHAVG